MIDVCNQKIAVVCKNSRKVFYKNQTLDPYFYFCLSGSLIDAILKKQVQNRNIYIYIYIYAFASEKMHVTDDMPRPCYRERKTELSVNIT